MSSPKQPAAEFAGSVRQLIHARELAEAERCLRDRIFSDPLDATAFALLAEVRALSGKGEAARVAARRSRQLHQIAANAKTAPSAEQFRAVTAYKENPADSIELNGFRFAGLRLHKSEGQICAVGCSTDGRAFFKIELCEPADSLNGLNHEIEVLGSLSERRCVSSARVLDSGMIDWPRIESLSVCEEFSGTNGDRFGKKSCAYVVLEYARADRGGFGVADICLALLEQQALGIYQNCIALPQIRFDSLQGVCRLTDFRSAVVLGDEIRQLSPRSFLQWCCEREEERSSSGGSVSFLEGRSEEIEKLFSGDQFLLVRTQIFARQRIADSPVPFIQDVNIGQIVLRGTTPVADRIELLDDLAVHPGERVLDLGCGAGGISRYFAKRGCDAVGVDCDPQLIRQAQLLANLEGCQAFYRSCDLEYDFPDGSFDTVLALIVLPHVSRRIALAKKITSTGANRILIECAGKDPGFRWQGGAFHEVGPRWEFKALEDLEAYLRKLFPDFSDPRLLGATTTKRSLLLLERKESSS